MGVWGQQQGPYLLILREAVWPPQNLIQQNPTGFDGQDREGPLSAERISLDCHFYGCLIPPPLLQMPKAMPLLDITGQTLGCLSPGLLLEYSALAYPVLYLRLLVISQHGVGKKGARQEEWSSPTPAKM